MRLTVAIPVLAAALAVLAPPARADVLSLKGRFNDWAVYVRERAGDTICYAVTSPRTWEPAEAGDYQAWLYISTFIDDDEKDQISVTSGAALDAGDPPAIVIKKRRYEMSSQGRRAYMKDGEQETALRLAMARETYMVFEGRSATGNTLEYTFSLRGSAAAIRHARSVCK